MTTNLHSFLLLAGGYLKGEIRVPKASQNQFLRLSLVPAQPDPASNPLNLHPHLLYINTRKDVKVPNETQTKNVDWSVVIFIHALDGSLFLVDDKSKPRFQPNKERTQARIEMRKKRPSQR